MSISQWLVTVTHLWGFTSTTISGNATPCTNITDVATSMVAVIGALSVSQYFTSVSQYFMIDSWCITMFYIKILIVFYNVLGVSTISALGDRQLLHWRLHYRQSPQRQQHDCWSKWQLVITLGYWSHAGKEFPNGFPGWKKYSYQNYKSLC